MKLFDDFDSRPTEPPQHRRSEFEYLNETGIPQGAPIRALLEEAFANFSGDQTDLRSRFRSKDNAMHVAAAFELVLHEVMLRQGLKPTSPEVAGGRPDLRVTCADGSTVVVEARMLQPGENIHYRNALDAIASVKRPRVVWHVWIDDDPKNAVSSSALVAKLKEFADAHPPESLPTTFSSTGPHLIFEQDKTRLRIYATCNPDKPKGCMSWHEADGEFADSDDLRKAIKRKKGKYDLTEPYVLALCSAKGYSAQRHFREALLRESRGAGAEDLRGIWAKGDGSRVSGVLACYSFKPASIHAARMQLFINPNAQYQLGENPFGCALASTAQSDFNSATTPLQTLLKLPIDWPAS